MKKDLGTELRMMRTRVRLTLRELETFFGGHPSYLTIFKVENHRCRPRSETLAKIKVFIKMDPQAVAARMRLLGIKRPRRGE